MCFSKVWYYFIVQVSVEWCHLSVLVSIIGRWQILFVETMCHFSLVLPFRLFPDHFAHSTVRKSSRAQALSALIKRPGSSYHRRWMGSTEDITDGDKVSPKSTPTSSRETSPHVQLRRRGSVCYKTLSLGVMVMLYWDSRKG